MMTDLEKHLKARNKAFATTDLEWARKMLPQASSDKVVEIGFHKARYGCTVVADELRLASRDWLEERNYGPLFDRTFPKNRTLPR